MSYSIITDLFFTIILSSLSFLTLFFLIYWERITLLANPFSLVFNYLKNSVEDKNNEKLYEIAHTNFHSIKNEKKAKELLLFKLSQSLDFRDISSIMLLVEILEKEGQTKNALKILLKSKKIAPHEFEQQNGSKQLDRKIGLLHKKLGNNVEANKYLDIYLEHNNNIINEIESSLNC